MPRLRDKAHRITKGPGFAYLAVVAALFFGVYEKSHHDAQTLRKSQLAGCERGKQDRLDHVRVYRAMSVYYSGVVHAVSVGGDIKQIARQIRDELNTASRGQASRVLECVPLIDDGRKVPDRRLLRLLPR